MTNPTSVRLFAGGCGKSGFSRSAGGDVNYGHPHGDRPDAGQRPSPCC